MLDRLKCCICILFTKQYAVFTADKYKTEKFFHCSFRVANHAFLQAIIEYTEKVDNKIKSMEE